MVRTALAGFPISTVHVIVVDPGVGSDRRAVAVNDGERIYLGPDNGTFAYLQPDSVHLLDNDALHAEHVSPTFHGRDVFAPVAAHLAHDIAFRGKVGKYALAEVGSRTTKLVGLPWGQRLRGEGRVIHVDHFGNLISDLPGEELGEPGVVIAGQYAPLHRTYADVAPGQRVAYVGSAGTIEVGVRDGRADRELAVPRGTPVLPSQPNGPYR